MAKSNTPEIKITDKCITFVKRFFHIYIEKCNFSLLVQMLDENILWFCSENHEICKNIQDTIKCIENESEKSQKKFEITDQWYEAFLMNDNFCTVIGELKLTDTNGTPSAPQFTSRFSMICHIKDNTIKLFHSNLSLQTGFESRAMEEYNLADNISGGIQIFKYEDAFPILYVNDGFLDLTGYTREEIFSMKNHMNMVLPEDRKALVRNIKKQLNNGSKFSVEYRLTKKDGSIIWVLNKGTLIKDNLSCLKIQSILVDITEQKETEIMLKVSEKRYKMALTFSDITMYEYNVITKDLILFERDSKMYDVPNIVKNGPTTFVETGIVESEYVHDFLEMYNKIHNGESSANCYIKARDVDNVLHDYELSMTNIYDTTGKPVYAIGVRKNITQLRQLQREKQYGKTLTSNQQFIYEVNVTDDKIITMDKEWSNQFELDGILKFTEMKEIICQKAIHPDYIQTILNTLSKENITNIYKIGDRLIHIEYERKTNNNGYQWFRKNINIIKDEFSGDITIRCYIININEEKQKERKQLENKRLYDTVLAKSSDIYEINFTKDIFISGCELWWKPLELAQTNSYSTIINAFLKKFVHPDDWNNFYRAFLLHNIRDFHTNGITPIECDYRYHNRNDIFTWQRCSIHLYEDIETKDLKGYSYIEDIDAQKNKELELIYSSEHDALTSLYNKATVEKYITDFLSNSLTCVRTHAIFIIDIDYFKSVNDSFGHADGDIVLAQVSHKIKESFRTIDIVGRIGGDEFIVLMKNIPDENTVCMKSHELCDKIQHNYIKNNISLKITISIGIAFYPEHGTCYKELFQCADKALYVSKEKGRNRHTIYNATMK